MKTNDNYQVPPIELLDEHPDWTPNVPQKEISKIEDSLINFFNQYKLQVLIIEASIGHTVTRYKVTLNTKNRQICIRDLQDDLSFSLESLGGCVNSVGGTLEGLVFEIDVPNQQPRAVSMRELISSQEYQDCGYELPIAIGKTIENKPFIYDLAKAPHIIIAGATGQGKSVCLHVIISSLLYKEKPEDLKFVLIDPKNVEFDQYRKISNAFFAPIRGNKDIITGLDETVDTLNCLCEEMERRDELLRMAGVRNIKEYNEAVKGGKLNPDEAHGLLPYIVTIIDEYGDLVIMEGKKVETPLLRIAQKARAVGMHAIIATQRPSIDVLTGVIRANFPARIAFRVVQSVNSRTILDQSGAEKLKGRGDSLTSFMGKIERVQCAYVDNREIEAICNHIGAYNG